MSFFRGYHYQINRWLQDDNRYSFTPLDKYLKIIMFLILIIRLSEHHMKILSRDQVKIDIQRQNEK